MANPFPDVEWEACRLEKKRHPELESYARKRIGMVPDSVPYLVSCPWLVRAEIDLSFAHGLLTELDLELAEVICMAVSQEGSCRYCYSTSRTLLRIQGMSEAEVRAVEARLSGSGGDRRAAAAISYARRLARANPLLTTEDLRLLEASGFSRTESLEVAFVAAYMVMANRVATLCALPPEDIEKAPDSWIVRGFRPAIAWLIIRHVRRGTPVAAAPAGDVPQAGLVAAYAGLPIAPALHRVFSEVWQPSSLSRRCKALLFAVIGRGLGCALSETIARKILAEEGFGADALTQALGHLRSAQLDAVESRLLPFARQTIWYRPAQVQREAAKLLEALSPEQFVEAVGVIAIANGFCRLNAAVVERT